MRCCMLPTRWNAAPSAAPQWDWLDPSKKLVVVTAHRRESFGDGIERICEALARNSRRAGDVRLFILSIATPTSLVRSAAAWRTYRMSFCWSRLTTRHLSI